VTGQSLRRIDQLLNEIVELVETARAVPMSGSCLIPREHALDLLDELRDAIPPQVDEAHRVLLHRDVLLAEAEDVRRQALGRATADAEVLLADAQQQAHQLVSDAEVRAHEILEAGKAEHADLVSASRVHQSAAEGAATLRADADRYLERTRADADEYGARQRSGADEYAAAMRTDAESFADQTLADLVAVLRRATATAEQGRQALAARREGWPPDGGPPDDGDRPISS
jgi:cell division septum initiation protein DivIVA